MRAARHVAATVLVATSVAGCSWFPMIKRPPPVTQITDLGNGAYSLTRRSSALPERSYVLMSDAQQQALAFCAEKHLALAMLDTRADDPDPPAYSYATISFRCLKP
jgi:hypothetical protein